MPPLKLCGDNGAMIGAQGYYEYLAGRRAGLDLNAYATMDLGEAGEFDYMKSRGYKLYPRLLALKKVKKRKKIAYS